MKVITVLNEKGGVGKTTLATTLAAGLAIQGKQVLLIDTDMQANATTRLGLRKEPTGGFYDLMVRGATLQQVVREVSRERIAPEVRGGLYIIPGNEQNMHIANSVSSVDVVFEAIQPLNGMMDYIIIDTAPQQTMLHVATYVAGDAILYPTTLSADSVSGVITVSGRRQAANVMRQGMGQAEIEVLGIQPIAANTRQIVEQNMLDILTERFHDQVLPPMARRVVWSEAEAQRMTVFAYAPDSAAAEEAWQFVRAASGVKEL
ncbi:MAG: ParA family protein [Phototrophicaceae bacterium]|jgi:chromosome partitioning protein